MNIVARPLNPNVARKANASMTPPNCARTAEAARTMRRSQLFGSESTKAQARRPPNVAPMMAVWAERVMERTNASRKVAPLRTVTMFCSVGVPSSDWNAPMTTIAVGRSMKSVTYDEEGDERKMVACAAQTQGAGPT